MPYRSPSKCSQPGCNVYCVSRLCEAHAELDLHKRNSTASPQDKQFYNSKYWRFVRQHQLVFRPFCEATLQDGQPCNRNATHVDHKIARKDGGSNNGSNLQSLCTSCHSRKTATTDGGFGNPIKALALAVVLLLTLGSDKLVEARNAQPAQLAGYGGVRFSNAILMERALGLTGGAAKCQGEGFLMFKILAPLLVALFLVTNSPAVASDHPILGRVAKCACAPSIVVGGTAAAVTLSAANLAAAVVIAPFATARWAYRYAVEDMTLVEACK